MNEYDVVVVGAGPAGSAAAKAAAERGAKTILLEEHVEVGIPQHCSGAFHSNRIEPTRFKEFVESLDKRLILTEYRKWRFFAPSGKLVKEASLPGGSLYLIPRDHFDRELARRAVNAGADLRLNTRVTGLLKQDGKVIGVTTSSTTMPQVHGKVVIGADGLFAAQKGIPKWEGLTRPGQTFYSGIHIELTRVKDIEPDVVERYYGAFSQRGESGLWPRDNVSCTIDFTTMAEFERIKAGNLPISRKLRDAMPLQITGFRHTGDAGMVFPKIVGEGLILAGNSGNFMTTWAAIVTGNYAGEVAAEAIREGDVTEKKLGKYVESCKALFKTPKPFLNKPIYRMSDEAIEEAVPEMAAQRLSKMGLQR